MADTILIILGILFSLLLLAVIILFIIIIRLTLQIRKLALDSKNALIKNMRDGVGSIVSLIPSFAPLAIIKRVFRRKVTRKDMTKNTNTQDQQHGN